MAIKRRLGVQTLLSALLVGALLVNFWEHLERRFVFFPTQEVALTPADAGLSFEDVYFTTSDGRRLNGWYIPGAGNTTWLWFHGNGGDMGHRVEELALAHHTLGVNLFIFDYRGYGRSAGQPSERGTYGDARAALEYLRGRADATDARVVYFGRSLGTAVAVELAAEHPPAGMILVSPFASLRDMSRLSMPQLPIAAWLAGNRYNSLGRIDRVNCPVLVVHGERDDIVPPSQGRALYEAANEPKSLRLLPNAGHNDTCSAGGTVYWDALQEFMDSLP